MPTGTLWIASSCSWLVVLPSNSSRDSVLRRHLDIEQAPAGLAPPCHFPPRVLLDDVLRTQTLRAAVGAGEVAVRSIDSLVEITASRRASNDPRSAAAGEPDELAIDAGVQLAASPMVQVEGVQLSQQGSSHHAIQAASAGTADRSRTAPVSASTSLWPREPTCAIGGHRATGPRGQEAARLKGQRKCHGCSGSPDGQVTGQ
jgi:hypothetical protein